MTLKTKLLIAQIPLAAALVGVGAFSVTVTRRLGAQGRYILTDNDRSVQAAERMKDALARLDRHGFEVELAAQEGNITETGEAAVTRELRDAWGGCAPTLTDRGASALASPDR